MPLPSLIICLKFVILKKSLLTPFTVATDCLSKYFKSASSSMQGARYKTPLIFLIFEIRFVFSEKHFPLTAEISISESKEL